jgi:hypothetical protein
VVGTLYGIPIQIYLKLNNIYEVSQKFHYIESYADSRTTESTE